jgi:hypothetical protein
LAKGETFDQDKSFFYGWFMDPALLKDKGLSPSDPVVAKLPNYKFILGQRASMISCNGQETWGTLIELEQQELDQLYSEPSVKDYVAIDVTCEDKLGRKISAKTYILPGDYKIYPPESTDYARTLYDICEKLKLPKKYMTTLTSLIYQIDSSK